MSKCLKLFLLSFLLFSGASSYAAKCGKFKGKVVIANFSWKSAQMIASVDKAMLEAMGCKVEIVSGDTIPSFTSMSEKGTPHIIAETWASILPSKQFNEHVKSGRIKIVNKKPITGVGEGWWITPYTLKAHPEFKKISEILKRPDLFKDKEDPSKGAFFGCPAGWGCFNVNENLFRAFKLKEKGWKLINPGSGAGLSGSVAKASEQGKNWFGYYWAPTAVIGKYNLKKVDFGHRWGGKKNWDCISSPKDRCVNPKPTSFKKSAVYTVTGGAVNKRRGKAIRTYLKKRKIPADEINKVLVWMEQNNADGIAGAKYFLKNTKIWKKWVSRRVASKVLNSL